MNKYVTAARRYIYALMLAAAASVTLNAETIRVTTPNGKNIVVSAITPDIIRVENFPKGEKPSDTLSPDITQEASENPVMTEDGSKVFTTSTGVSVKVNPTTGAVDINGGSNRIIIDNGTRYVSGG